MIRRALQGTAFVGVHIACLGVVFTGVSIGDLAWCFGLYLTRLFGITAGYHRYFAHRSYRMGRGMQLAMALLAMSSGQKGVLWWASHHRRHHRRSDRPGDPHSPRLDGLWAAHVGWILGNRWPASRNDGARDLAAFPELRWLDRHPALPVVGLAIAVLLIDGPSAFVVGFCWSTVLCNHAIFSVNSVAHRYGSRRFATADDSRNNLIVALLSLGAGWHNNHHHHPAAARHGLSWREPDLTYCGLRLLAWLGLVSDLKEHPHVEKTSHRHR
jgi:stearoyl-CoA desaturase (delta-9 desaturase)